MDHWMKPALSIVFISVTYACPRVWDMEGFFSPQSYFELGNSFPESGVGRGRLNLRMDRLVRNLETRAAS